MCVHTHNSIMTSRVPPFTGWFLPIWVHRNSRALCHRSRALRFLPVTLARLGRSRVNVLARRTHRRLKNPPPTQTPRESATPAYCCVLCAAVMCVVLARANFVNLAASIKEEVLKSTAVYYTSTPERAHLHPGAADKWVREHPRTREGCCCVGCFVLVAICSVDWILLLGESLYVIFIQFQPQLKIFARCHKENEEI